MLTSLFLILFASLFVSLGIPYVAADNYVEMLDDFKKKDGIAKLFGVSGHTSSNFANMTITFPDESTTESSVSVTDRGYFQTFIMLDSTDPAGLYTVVIHPYNDTAISSQLDTAFFLSDYDGMLDIHIKRNAVLDCKDSSEYCVEPAISHIPKSFGVRFFNDDYNTHQMKIGSITGDLILPDGDSISYPLTTGTFEYNCVIHPWINGKLHVTDVPSIKYIDDAVDVIFITSIPVVDGIIQNNNLQAQYDTDDCGICYVGIVTKIIDGDTIHVDTKPVRLALVNTPEKKQTGYTEANEFVSNSCPVGSSILVDVDDIYPSDSRGVEFAQVTCGVLNINESLMVMELAKMYDSSCTESEFMYETWARHDCVKPVTIFDELKKDIHVPIIITNNTDIPLNVTASIEIISNDDAGIIYIIVVTIVLVICLALWYVKKDQSSQNTSFTSIEFLE